MLARRSAVHPPTPQKVGAKKCGLVSFGRFSGGAERGGRMGCLRDSSYDTIRRNVKRSLSEAKQARALLCLSPSVTKEARQQPKRGSLEYHTRRRERRGRSLEENLGHLCSAVLVNLLLYLL